MKILWHSNAPWAPSGYGSQTQLFAPLIRDAGHDVAISAFWGLSGAPLKWDGMKVYPADRNYGNEWLCHYAADHAGGDPTSIQVITLMDVWVMRSKAMRNLNMASWCPIDHTPVPPAVMQFFGQVGATPIAMSRFGEDQLRRAGLDPLYVPHGVDTTRMRPVDASQFRDQLNVPRDAFMVGMVAANKGNNPPRKAFPQAFTAFALFHKRHPDSVLYLHTELVGGEYDINIPMWLEMCGIPETAVRHTPQFEYHIGVPYERMPLIYSALDVLLAPSYGEGFGIPIVEAQACGTPVIVNDFSAMAELCGSGWRIDGQPDPHVSQGAWWQAPNIGSMVEALEDAYQTARGMRAQAREFALGYDTNLIMDTYWTPVLRELQDRLEARTTMPAVSFMRRQPSQPTAALEEAA